jgi:hypothetical protein
MSGRDFDRDICRRFQKRFGSARFVRVSPSAKDLTTRAEEIAELAEAVAGEHCPQGIVAPEVIARASGITLSFGAYGEGFDGMLEHRSGRFHIFCNADRVGPTDSPRARFTLAHELGHYYIDDHRRALASGGIAAHPSQCDSESTVLAEQEADHFAANLLMPSSRFNALARRCARGLAGILALADAFKTSITSTAIRYVAADISPCAVVKWNWKGYAWKRLSSSTFQARLRRTFETPTELPEDSPTRRALAHQQPSARGYFESGTTAAAWFPRVGHEDDRNLIFIEQAIPLGAYGVLTFLYPDEPGRLLARACAAAEQ